jgi:hypothetical protein
MRREVFIEGLEGKTAAINENESVAGYKDVVFFIFLYILQRSWRV